MNSHWLKGILITIIFESLFLVLNLSLSAAQTGIEDAQNQTLVIGTGTIVGGNVPEARSMAISEALVKGVEEYLARRLGSEGMINNFLRLLQDVIPNAKEGIENFNILAEERMDNHYKILVRVKVNDKVIEERLRETGIVLMEGPQIRVLFLVSQIGPSEGELSYWWKEPEADFALTSIELALYRVFQERGFYPINRLTNIPEGEYFPEMKVLNLSDESAIGWGKLFLADVVIRGRCEIIEGKEVSVMLEALRVENGILIYQDMQSETIGEGPGSTDQVVETIEIAVNNLVSRMSSEIMMAMQLPEPVINRVELILRGLRSFRQFEEFKGFLENEIAAVKSVKQTRISGNSMFISVEFLGDKKNLLDMISKQASLPFATDVNRTEEGEIIVVIREFP